MAAEIAVFRAAHRVAPEDSRLLGAQQYAARPRTIGRLLHDAAVDAIGRRRPAVARFRQLIDSIDPRIRSDSFWPQLAEHLAQAAPSRPDLAHLVVEAASEHPLPDELPAAALWWRLSGKISHTATLDTPNAKIRPPWINDLARRVRLGHRRNHCRRSSPGQAGSAAMVSAIAEPNTACRSLIQGGRILALGVSRVAVWLILPDSRHHRAAAGSSSGSGCSDAASTTRWARSGRLGAAWARCSANCGQKLSLRMRGSMESMS